MTILEQLAGYARERTEKAKQKRPLSTLRQQAFSMPKGSFAFENAIKKPELSFICECKKASPSRGIIVSDFPYIQIAKEYENAGADCISVLTEPGWFLGKDAYLREIAEVVSIPCLRKDFTVDEYMLYEAKVLGASAVLLICSILSERQIQEYIGICDEMGISALVEAHDEKEVTTDTLKNRKIIFTPGSMFKGMIKSVSIQKLDSSKSNSSGTPDNGNEGNGEGGNEGGGEAPDPAA